ncbi:MAG: hypothetical protein KA120_05930 [Candidatus Goldbacteria bacterium]|nr:hypothetical protein [Candidatus Goldiibacteriota bacterium]
MKKIKKRKSVFKNVCVGGGGFVSGVVFHPSVKGLVYLRTDMGGAYKRTAKSTEWTCITDMFGKEEAFFNGVLSIALVENDDAKIYMMCGKYTGSKFPDGRLYVSDDYGFSWKWFRLPFKTGSNEKGRGMGERLAVSPVNPDVLFAGSTYDGLWKSINAGKTWKKIQNFPSKDVNFLLFDRSPEKRLIVATADGNIYVSEDCGIKWSKVDDVPSGMAYRADVLKDGRIYFTFDDSKGPWGIKNGSVWEYDLNSKRWRQLNVKTDTGGFAGIAVFPDADKRLLVSTICRNGNDEIFFSKDGGKKFMPVLKNSKWESFAPYTKTMHPHWISDVKINPCDAGNVIWVTGYGIWETFDFFGKKITWHFNDNGIEETVPMQIISPPKIKTRLISVMGDIDGFVHVNLNKSPEKRHTPVKKTTLAIDYAGLNPDVLVKAYNSGLPFGAYSVNAAENWIDFKSRPAGATAGGVRSIAISADAKSIVWAATGAKVSYSHDYGNTWHISRGGVPAGYWIVSDKVSAGIFYVYDGKNGVLWKSEDHGMNFFVVNSGLPDGKEKPGNDGMIDYEINCVYNKKNDVWLAAGGDGLFYSDNGGKKFIKIKSVKEAYRIGFGKEKKSGIYPCIYVWAKTGNVTGFFTSPDFARNWLRINDDRHQYGWIHCITGDPEIYGRCYLSAEGRGIIYIK